MIYRKQVENDKDKGKYQKKTIKLIAMHSILMQTNKWAPDGIARKPGRKKNASKRKQRLGSLGRIMFILYFRGFTVEFVIDLLRREWCQCHTVTLCLDLQ